MCVFVCMDTCACNGVWMRELACAPVPVCFYVDVCARGHTCVRFRVLLFACVFPLLQMIVMHF